MLLFRKEALDNRDARWNGSIRLTQPVGGWFIVLISLLITVSVFAFCIFGSFTKKARVTGITAPVHGSLSILSPVAGILLRSNVKEGQYVAKGEVIFELSTERAGVDGELTALVSEQIKVRELAALSEVASRNEKFVIQKNSVIQKIEDFDVQERQLLVELSIAYKRRDLAQALLQNMQALNAQGFISLSQLQLKEDEVLAASARVSNLLREKSQIAANKSAAIADKSSLVSALRSDMAQLESSQASLKQQGVENENRKITVVKAPLSGRITTLGYYEGQSLGLGQALATLIPGTEKGSMQPLLEVHLYVPSRTAGFVEIGQEVQIRYQAFPYQMFGLQKGVVSGVSQTPFSPNDLPSNVSSTVLNSPVLMASVGGGRENLYRVIVKINRQNIEAYGKSQRIKAGMTLDADVVQDHRKIWQWILAPAIAVAKR